jgi:NDP-sugar pyrophosphorylase family protein
MKLNQIIAISNGEKTKLQKSLTTVYQNCSKTELFNGFARAYSPKDDDGEKLPKENKGVQITVKDVLNDISKVIENAYNVIGTQDATNCKARVDVKVGNSVIMENVPVTYLLFLEKQITDLTTLVNSLPILDSAEKWVFSKEQNAYLAEEKETTKTKKILQNHVKSPATDKHPAQVDVFTEDVIVGYWKTIKYSGCISKTDKDALLEKIRSLDKAIKIAREEANSIEVEAVNYGSNLVSYLCN